MGHHGWGHFHTGGWGGWGGWGGGIGWLFPALIVGKILGEAFDNPQQQQPWGGTQPWSPQRPQPQPAPQPQPQPQAQPRPTAAPATATLRCVNCGGAVTSQFSFCPHCGWRLYPPACLYCGQTLDPKSTHCDHCGAPRRR